MNKQKAARVNFLHFKKATPVIYGPFRAKEDKIQTSPDPHEWKKMWCVAKYWERKKTFLAPVLRCHQLTSWQSCRGKTVQEKTLEGKSVFKGVRKNYLIGNTGSREGYVLFISDKGREIKTWLTSHLKILFLVWPLFQDFALRTKAHNSKNSGRYFLFPCLFFHFLFLWIGCDNVPGSPSQSIIESTHVKKKPKLKPNWCVYFNGWEGTWHKLTLLGKWCPK